MKDYKTTTISKKVGCGRIFCLFLEDDGVFYKLFIKGNHAKETACGESWFCAIAKLITYSMRRSIWEGNTKEGIIKQLLGQRCSMAIADPKEHVVSCSDAISKCVLKYCKMRDLVKDK